ncbi:hypothetical protein ANCDUO_17300 [Ancylostoma duodenale]|uniref:Major facilitator superfamily (MFS) profile domain-containing protein n=1 Tax=Ancylostoma duodenale TaxID=51022 RepID=A0A0C2G688_9BILA|nr:hypothetical protein ANCDUO_17300 [Ancylostoma duodenale]
MVYMVYAGISPTINGCGSVAFNSSSEACEILSGLRAASNCAPNIDYQFKSVNVEFDLLCEDGHLVKNSISIQMLGVLIGAMISGQMSDRYGRKTVLIASLLGVSVFSLGTALAFTFVQFTVLRAVVGIFTGGLSACLYESPRWLIHHGRIERARVVLAHIRKLNGKTCEKEAEEVEAMLMHEQNIFDAKQKKRKHYHFYHLVYTWKYLVWTVTVCSGM